MVEFLWRIDAVAGIVRTLSPILVVLESGQLLLQGGVHQTGRVLFCEQHHSLLEFGQRIGGHDFFEIGDLVDDVGGDIELPREFGAVEAPLAFGFAVQSRDLLFQLVLDLFHGPVVIFRYFVLSFEAVEALLEHVPLGLHQVDESVDDLAVGLYVKLTVEELPGNPGNGCTDRIDLPTTLHEFSAKVLFEADPVSFRHVPLHFTIPASFFLVFVHAEGELYLTGDDASNLGDRFVA